MHVRNEGDSKHEQPDNQADDDGQGRHRPDRKALEQAAAWIRASQRPLIVAGGGVIYSGATDLLQRFVDQTGVPVGETMAGKGSLRYDHPLNLGAIGATGTFAANRI